MERVAHGGRIVSVCDLCDPRLRPDARFLKQPRPAFEQDFLFAHTFLEVHANRQYTRGGFAVHTDKLLLRMRPVLLSLSWLLVLVLLVGTALLPAVAASADGFPRTVVDGTGVAITLKSPPQRIFSAGLAMENILLSITDPSRVVGVTRFAKDPTYSYVADRVMDHMVIIDQINAEQVVAANPDIVLVAFWSDPDAVRQIKDLGLVVYTFTSFDTVQDALDNIIRMGEITGDEAVAQSLVQQFHETYAEVQSRIEGRSRPRVLNYEVWGSTAGLGTSIHDIIEMAGGLDVAAEHGIAGWKDIDTEAILLMNPDVIVTSSGEHFVETLLADEALSAVSAVKHGRVYHVDHMEALNHHFIHAIVDLAKKLHPEAF